MTHNSST